MRLTLITVTLVSWLGISGISDPFWTLLEFFRPSGTLEKAGANADPDGLTCTSAPAGCGMDPDGLTGTAPAGATADPNG